MDIAGCPKIDSVTSVTPWFNTQGLRNSNPCFRLQQGKTPLAVTACWENNATSHFTRFLRRALWQFCNIKPRGCIPRGRYSTSAPMHAAGILRILDAEA